LKMVKYTAKYLCRDDKGNAYLAKDVDARIAKLTSALSKARNELACLVPDPQNPDFTLCLRQEPDSNSADKDCLKNAYRHLTEALGESNDTH
jgi:hypothetical protein